MKKDLGAKALILPLPVLIVGTFDRDGQPNAMNAAWGTVCDTDKLLLVLSAQHKTVKNMLQSRAFTVSIADQNNAIPADYVGIASANDTPDKIKNTGWAFTKSKFVNAPVFDKLPLCIECELLNYDPEDEIAVGKIVNTCADEEILTQDKRIDLNLFKPLCYDCTGHTYRTLSNPVAKAFCDGKQLKK